MSAGSDPIEVVPSGQNRVELFAIAEPSSGSLAPFVLEIDHIGSTAVPGLAAKPVIDIPVGVRTLDDSAKIVSAVGSLGYEYVPEFEDQRRIAATSGGASTAAVASKYISSSVPTATGGIPCPVRDWLRNHDDDRDRYAELKLNLAATRRVGMTAGRTPTRDRARDQTT